jgi:hypothetical protein
MALTSILNSGEVGNIGLKQISEARQQVAAKWEELGLLDGLKGARKENIATLYENQAHHMLYESTVSDASGAFETVAFPIIRRTFAKLLANDVVSIQAMPMPVGRLYFINPKISKRVGGKQDSGSHTTMDGVYSNGADNYSKDGELRRVAKTGGTQYETTSLYDRYYATETNDYGDALFNRTSGEAQKVTGTLTATVATGAAKVKGLITGFSTTKRGKLVGPVGIPADTEEFMSSLKVRTTEDLFLVGEDGLPTTTVAVKANGIVDFRILAQRYGEAIVNANGEIAVELDLTTPNGVGYGTVAPAAGNSVSLQYEYIVYSDLEGDAEIAEVSFDFDYVTVDVGEPKKLRASFTPEVKQDVQSFQSIDVEAELSAMLSDTVSAEIDREILRDLRAGAAWFDRWNYRGYDAMLKAGVVGFTRKDYNQELISVINRMSAAIHKSTLRGGATWIIVSPEISAVFNDLEYFHVTNAEPEETKYSLGIEKIGALQNRYQVYTDVYAPANTILMGHKGDGIFHAGYIYAPYCPLMLFPKVINPGDFRTVMGIMTRYAKKMVNNRFFGKILVDGLHRMDVSDFTGVA